MRIQSLIKNLIRRFGFDLSLFNYKTHPLARRKHVLHINKTDIVIDVGANIGQYGKELRTLGYKNKIISFEPQSSAFTKLEQITSKDNLWDAYHYALSNINGTQSINIAQNSYSSSLLKILPQHTTSAPESKYIGKEVITTKTLDSIFAEITNNKNSSIFLKIDTQGYEKKVLDGAFNVLPYIQNIQLEMSLVPLYDGEMPIYEMLPYLKNLGYKLISFEEGFVDPTTGHLLQIDGIFERT